MQPAVRGAEPRGPGLPFLLVAALLGTLAWRFLPEVRSSVREGERYRFHAGPVEVLGRPAWVPERIIAEIAGAMADLDGQPLLDPGLPGKVRERLLSVPWVREVRSVRPVLPDRLGLDLRLRRAAARVPTREGAVEVAEDGVRLPELPGTGAPGSQVEVLLGELPAPPLPGRPFPDPAVAAGARLARTLGSSAGPFLARRLPIAALDMSNNEGRRDPRLSEVVLVHRGDRGEVRVDWGRGPGRDRLDPPAEAKLGNLEAVVRALPMPAPVGAISVRFDEPTVRPRDGAAQAASTARASP